MGKGYGDVRAIFDIAKEMAEERAAFRTKLPRVSKDKADKPDLFQLLQQKRQEAVLLENFIKEMEKVNKKEDKKYEGWWNRMTTPQLAMIMIVLVPVYMSFLQRILH